MKDMVENVFPENPQPSAPPESLEEVLVIVRGVILHLIDKHYSVELASGDLSIVRLWQGNNSVAVLARVGQEIQWPLAKDEASVKVDGSHYFFSLRAVKENGSWSDSSEDEGNENWLNYGLTISPKGQEPLVEKLDEILDYYSCFTKVVDVSKEGMETLEIRLPPSEKDKEFLEERSSAYWTTLAPNVEDYSGTAARSIAAGSGQLVKGILWCGDVTVERLKWGNEFLKNRMSPAPKTEISPQTMKNIKRFCLLFFLYVLVFFTLPIYFVIVFFGPCSVHFSLVDLLFSVCSSIFILSFI